MSNIFPNLRKLPPDVEQNIKISMGGDKFEFLLTRNATEHHEEFLVAFLKDFNGLLGRIGLVAGRRGLQFPVDTQHNRVSAGLYCTTFAEFTLNRYSIVKTGICTPAFVCSIPHSGKEGHSEGYSTSFFPPTDAACISFVRYSLLHDYQLEALAQFIPEKYALSFVPSKSFVTFREIVYAAIAAERILNSNIPLETKFTQIYYCALARCAAEQDVFTMTDTVI